MSSLRTAAAIGGAALLSGLALVACGESDPTISTNAGGSDAPMTDAEFCSAIKTDLVDPAEAAASPTDLTSTTDPGPSSITCAASWTGRRRRSTAR